MLAGGTVLIGCAGERVQDAVNQTTQATTSQSENCPEQQSQVQATGTSLVCGAGTEENSGQCFPIYPLVTCGKGTRATGTPAFQECVPDLPLSCGPGTAEKEGKCLPTSNLSGSYSITETIFDGACNDNSVMFIAGQGTMTLKLIFDGQKLTGEITGSSASTPPAGWTLLEKTEPVATATPDDGFTLTTAVRQQNNSLGWETNNSVTPKGRVSGNSLTGFATQSVKVISTAGILLATCTAVSTIEGIRL